MNYRQKQRSTAKTQSSIKKSVSKLKEFEPNTVENENEVEINTEK